jgi:transposase
MDNALQIKTIEFKLYLNQPQIAIFDDWLDKGRHIWNKGLAVLEELQQQKWSEKAGLDPLESKVKLQWHRNNIEGIKAKDKDLYGLACSIAYSSRRLGLDYVPAVSLRFPKVLDGAPKSLIYQASGTYGMCTRFKNGIIADLMESWKAYQSKTNITAKRTKYKGRRFPLRSLSNGSGTIKVVSDTMVRFPLIGDLRTKGLKRLPPDCKICIARICKKTSGWYLQIVIKADLPIPVVKHPDTAIAIDPGVVFAISTDYGRQVESPRFLKQTTKKLRREQRKLSRRTLRGKNWQKQQAKIAKLHEKTSRQRTAFWQKETTYLTNQFGAIALEDNNLRNMTRRPKAKKREDGKGWEQNKAKAKGGLNKALLDVAAGQLKVMLPAKTKVRGSEFHLVPAHYNSQTCSSCGSIDKLNRVSQSLFRCLSCGFSDNADINACKNIHGKVEWSKPYKKVGTPVSLEEPD